MTPEEIQRLYDRPLTADDRRVLRRLIRQELMRQHYPVVGLEGSDDGLMNREQRQLYRIFMSVAAEKRI